MLEFDPSADIQALRSTFSDIQAVVDVPTLRAEIERLSDEAGAPDLWDDADAEFVPASDDDGGGRWYYNRPVPVDGWPLRWRETAFAASCTPFRHLGCVGIE